MNPFESFSQPKVDKEQLMGLYKKLIDKGITDPFGMDQGDADVVEANNLHLKWEKEGDEAAGDDPVAKARFDFQKTFFYLDAGFTDKEYAEEVLNEIVPDDLNDAQAIDAGLADEIRAKAKLYAEKLGIKLLKESPQEVVEEPTPEVQELVPLSPEQMNRPMATLEAENEFDDAWIAVAQTAGYTVFDDGKGRTIEKDGQRIKLMHYAMRAGNKTYKAIITNVDENIKPSTFGVQFGAKVSKAGIQKEFEKLLYTYEHRYDPEE